MSNRSKLAQQALRLCERLALRAVTLYKHGEVEASRRYLYVAERANRRYRRRATV